MIRDDTRGMWDAIIPLVGVLLVVAVAVAVVAMAVSAAPPISTLDGDTPLTSDAAVDEFEETGSVTVDLHQYNASITVADDHEDVGLDGIHVDAGNVYLRVRYGEEIPRTLRFFVPSSYFTPRVADPVEPVEGGPPATFSPAENSTVTAVRVEFSEPPTTVTYQVSTTTGTALGIREWVSERVGNVTGFSLPSLSSSEPWEYVGDDLGPTSPAKIRGHPETIVYDDEPGEGERWLAVPGCDDPETQKVCKYETGNATVIMSTQENPPTVRYRRTSGLFDGIRSSWSELTQLDDRVSDFFGGLFGSGDPETDSSRSSPTPTPTPSEGA